MLIYSNNSSIIRHILTENPLLVKLSYSNSVFISNIPIPKMVDSLRPMRRRTSTNPSNPSNKSNPSKPSMSETSDEERLRAELTAAKQQIKSVGAKLKRQKDRNDSLQSEIQRLRETQMTSKSLNKQLFDDNKALKSALTDMADQEEMSRLIVIEKGMEITHLQGLIVDKHAQFVEISSMYQRETDENDRMKVEIPKLKAFLKSLTDKVAHDGKEAVERKEQITELEDMQKVLVQRLGDLEKDNGDLRTLMDKQEKRINNDIVRRTERILSKDGW